MIVAIALLASFAQTPAQEPAPCDYIKQYVWDPKFTPGQKWSYHAPSTDPASTLTISEIDDVPGIGTVVHIRVDHLGSHSQTPFINPATEYFAIRRDSLDASVVSVLDHVGIPELGYSYSTYRAHCIALTYSTTVADTLTTLAIERCEQALKRNLKRALLPCKTATASTPAQTASSPQP